MWMILTIAAAALGGLLLLKMKVPGGMLVGAIVGAACLNLTTQQAFIYPQARVLAQSLTGAYIGCMMTREDVRHLPRLLRPYLVVISSLLVLNLAMTALICHTTDFDLLTSLFCSAPGGISDIPLIAMDMGADASAVAVMQFVRSIFGMACLPSIIVLSDRIIEPQASYGPEEKEERVKDARKPKPTLQGFLPTFACALAAGILGKLSGFPAGTMSAALIVSSALKLSGKTSGMPMWLRRVAQVISGCCIGAGLTRAQAMQIGQLFLPALALCLGYIVCCVSVGFLLHKLFHIRLREAMLTMSPAGATEMALIAADLGVESADLVVLQICRLVGVNLLFPHLFNLIVHIFS